MTTVYDTTLAMAVGNVTAQLYDNSNSFIGSPIVVPAQPDGSWSLELAPNDSTIQGDSLPAGGTYWGITVYHSSQEPFTWFIYVPAEGPISVRSCQNLGNIAQGFGVAAIAAGNGISIDPASGTGWVTITNTGGGGGGGLPVYSGTAGVSITDNSTDAILITENGASNVTVTANDGSVELTASNVVQLTGVNQQFVTTGGTDITFGTYATSADLPAASYARQMAYVADNGNGAPAVYAWNPTFDAWQPIPQNIGNVAAEVLGDNVTFLNNSLVVYTCPYYANQPVGLVSSAAPSAYVESPFATFAAGGSVYASITPLLTLLAAGSTGVPGWDYIDIIGSLTVTDGTTANYLTATFSANQLRSDTTSFNASLTQTGIGGTDLSTDGTNIISAAGGTYNVSLYLSATWD
jgi:hypothetical protein